MKKKISLATIVFVFISALIAIGALFGIFKLKGFILDLLFTSLTLTVCGILTINSCDMIDRKNKLISGSLVLILFSTLLVILCYWTNLDNIDGYMKLTLVISTLSIFFNLVSSSILKIGNNYKVIQMISYSCYFIVSLFLIFTFLDVINLEDDLLKIFILFIILSFVGLCILSVLSKKGKNVMQNNEEYIKISKKEYEELLNYKKELENLLKERRSNDDKLSK